MLKAIRLAKIGLSMETGIITSWLKQEGDFVKKNDPLYEVQTDKSVITVESIDSGYLKRILIKEGEEISINTIIAYIEE